MPGKRPPSFYEIREFEGLGTCQKSSNGKHQLRMQGFPNPEYWGDKIEESNYDFRCELCRQSFLIPYLKVIA